MLNALKFVKGSIASKGFAPELTHFKIEGGHIKGFNGSLALSSPIALDLDVAPKAVPFIKAITSCRATTAMSVTPTGRLSIKSGKFKALVQCVESDNYPDIRPEGEVVKLNGDFIEILRQLTPFMSEDASRPWSRGIMLKGRYATVTNNIVIVQAWLPEIFPIKINIPAQAVKELVRIKEEPCHLQVSENSITFHYEDGRWLRTNLNSMEWPDLDPIFSAKPNVASLPTDFFEALEDLKAFTDDADRVIFRDGKVSTTQVDDEVGASVELTDFPYEARFNLLQLQKIESIVDKIDFTMYPRPCIFYGDKLRGAIVGMRT